MNILKLKKIFLLIFIVTKMDAQEAHFDFAFNFSNIGWGMDIGDDNYHQINFNFCNFFIENINSNIGIEFSPFHSWFNANSTSVINFLNLSVHYNVSNYWNKSEKTGSNYMLVGPFIALNYMQLENFNKFTFDKFQVNSGVKLMVMIDLSEFTDKKGGLPAGIQIFNIELGYRFRNNNEHRFYFSLNTDIIPVLYMIGLFSDKPKEVEDYIKGEYKKDR